MRLAAGDERGLMMYGGGMGELGVARGQIQALASLSTARSSRIFVLLIGGSASPGRRCRSVLYTSRLRA